MELKNEKDLEEFIKQKAEEIPVPDSLKPENIVKQIKKESEKEIGKRITLENETETEKRITLENETEIGKRITLENETETEKRITLENETETGKRITLENETETGKRITLENETETGKKNTLESETEGELLKKNDHPLRKWMYRISAGAAVFACGALLAFGGLYGFGKRQEQQKDKALNGRESLCMDLLEQANKINTEFSAQKEWYQWAKKNGEDPEHANNLYKFDCVEESELMVNGAPNGVTSTETSNSAADLTLQDMKQEDEKREPDYSDTNVQVEGIDEADIIKTDGEYLYILDRGKVTVVKTNGGLEKVSEISLDEKDEYYEIDMYVKDQQMVILQNKKQFYCFDSRQNAKDVIENKARTKVLIYDISQKENPKLEKEIKQDGSYMSSRVKGDYLYLFTDYTTYTPKNIQDYDYYVPKIGEKELCYEDVCIFPEGNSSDSLLVSAISLKKQEVSDQIMLTSGSQLFYVSDENIYSVVYNYHEGKDCSEIVKIAYKEDKLELIGKTEVEGSIYDQYFMDEKNGFLRLVAHVYGSKGEELSRLYVLDSDLKEVGRIDDIAPEENLYSCRFMGNMAYFVTFRRVDPLFAADLSDPYNPKMVGQLKIPGFSEYLHPYGEGLLLGIGYDVDEETNRRKGVKLTMFDISDPTDLKELSSSYLPECSYFDQQPKAILANTKKNLIGISASRYDGDSYYYCFSYENGEFVKNMEQEIIYSGNTRGIYIGDVLYVANSYEVSAISLDDFSKIESLTLEKDSEEENWGMID